jgi:hypothetical protein
MTPSTVKLFEEKKGNDWWQMRDENDPRIERVARALCQTEGKDPDAKRQTNERETKWIEPTRWRRFQEHSELAELRE